MPLPTLFSFLGIAKETVKGTAVAASDYIPLQTIAPQDNVIYLPDSNMRGSMVDLYDEIQGPTFSEFSLGGDVFPDGIGYVLGGLLGDVTVTGASAPFTHAFAVKNNSDGQPPAFTLTDYQGSQARQYAGCQFSEAGFKFSGDGLLSFDAKAVGYASATAATPTKSFSTVKPIAAYRGALTIGGGSVTTLIDGTCDLKRSVAAIHAIDGSAQPYKVWVGALSVSGKLTFLAEDETELTRYLTNTQPALSLDFQQGAGSTLTQVKLVMTKCAYTVAAINRGKDYVAYDVTYNAIANSTDAGASGGLSPIKATIQNAKPSGSFV